jgi:Spy/CpxP family protein refolding chaperone
MKKTILLITATTISILLITIYGCRHRMAAMCGPKDLKNHVETMTKELSKKLDLTDEQKNQLNIIKDEIIVKLSERRKHRAEMFTIIREEIQKETIDQKRLENLFDSRKQFREDMHKFMLNKLTEFHSMLSKEQRIKLNTLIEKLEKQFNEE